MGMFFYMVFWVCHISTKVYCMRLHNWCVGQCGTINPSPTLLAHCYLECVKQPCMVPPTSVLLLRRARPPTDTPTGVPTATRAQDTNARPRAALTQARVIPDGVQDIDVLHDDPSSPIHRV